MAIFDRIKDRTECRRIRPLLQPFLDGELDRAQREQVASHLDACARCGLSEETYRSIKGRLHRLGLPPDEDTIARLEVFVEQLSQSEG